MRKELETIQLLWHQQKAVSAVQETIELINHKCHDLKHQVQAIRAVKDEKERETYLEKIEKIRADLQCYCENRKMKFWIPFLTEKKV